MFKQLTWHAWYGHRAIITCKSCVVRKKARAAVKIDIHPVSSVTYRGRDFDS